MAVKYVFVTGGVVSGLGKGITAASLGRLLKARGYKHLSVDSLLFAGLPDYGDITFVKNSAAGASLMLFDVSYSGFLKMFVSHES